MMQIQLSNGRMVTLGYRPDSHDTRDFRLSTPMTALPVRVDNRAKVRRILDQGSEGACTGFAACGAAELLFGACCGGSAAPDLSERWAYHHARKYDPWDGENYHGSTLRAALEGWQRHGMCEEPYWRYSPYGVSDRDPNFNLPAWEGTPAPGAAENALRFSLTSYHRLMTAFEIKQALAKHDVVLVGASVHSGWDIWGKDRIRFDRNAAFLGLHAFILVGYDDTDATFLVVNSWGAAWGDRGIARLSYNDLRVNLLDAWAAMIPCHCNP
jgi:hypothetical protein